MLNVIALDRQRDMDVPECARTLRLLVDQMCEDYEKRAADGPLNIGAVLFLARTLTDIVRMVCQHNRDIYEGSNWYRNQEPNEPERVRNLYAYLIGDPSFDPSSPPRVRDYFVIDRLRAFPAHGELPFPNKFSPFHHILGAGDLFPPLETCRPTLEQS